MQRAASSPQPSRAMAAKPSFAALVFVVLHFLYHNCPIMSWLSHINSQIVAAFYKASNKCPAFHSYQGKYPVYLLLSLLHDLSIKGALFKVDLLLFETLPFFWATRAINPSKTANKRTPIRSPPIG